MSFVVDASVALAWCFEDEATPYAESVLDRLQQTEAVVPAIWPLEVANVLLTAERRQRLTEAQTVRLAQLLRGLPITIDTEGLTQALGSTLSLGREYGLSAYDTSYLELAMRQGLSLATQDEALREAAARAGVPLVE
jgi:predicted nucleic acid-binding protein